MQCDFPWDVGVTLATRVCELNENANHTCTDFPRESFVFLHAAFLSIWSNLRTAVFLLFCGRRELTV